MLIPTGFWSYTTSDETSSRGKLSQLRALLAGELQQQIGREPRVNIFQDVAAIPPGAEWERQIRESIDRASFIIPIVTPGFLQSEWCCREVTLFREREARLGVRDLVFPIHYVDTEHLDGGDREVLGFLRTYQWIDFRHLRFKSLESEDVALLLERLSRSVLKALRAAWLVQQRAEAERQREEAARKASEAKRRDQAASEARTAEEGRQREAAARQADEVRRQKEVAAQAARRSEEETPTSQAPKRLSHEGCHQQAPAEPIEGSLQQDLKTLSPAHPAMDAALEGPQVPLGTRPGRSRLAGFLVVTVCGLILIAILLVGGTLSGVFNRGTELERQEEAARLGDASGMFALALRYDQGWGVAQDYAKAREWYEKAADAGNTSAMTKMGNLYEYGYGVPRDYAKAREFYEKGAEGGNADAMQHLSDLLDKRFGGALDKVEAAKWRAHAAAIRAGAKS